MCVCVRAFVRVAGWVGGACVRGWLSGWVEGYTDVEAFVTYRPPMVRSPRAPVAVTKLEQRGHVVISRADPRLNKRHELNCETANGADVACSRSKLASCWWRCAMQPPLCKHMPR